MMVSFIKLETDIGDKLFLRADIIHSIEAWFPLSGPSGAGTVEASRIFCDSQHSFIVKSTPEQIIGMIKDGDFV